VADAPLGVQGSSGKPVGTLGSLRKLEVQGHFPLIHARVMKAVGARWS
jgi:hypothetical protein